MAKKFYIGILMENGKEKMLIKSKDLMTHAFVCGASGSGKTVTCKAILEEAVLNDIPVVAIDPKGDIGGVAFAVKEPKPDEFVKWCKPEEKVTGKPAEELAKGYAELYKRKFEEYGIDGGRLKKYHDKIMVFIFTPGSGIGLRLKIEPELDPPKDYNKLLKEDPEAIESMIQFELLPLLKMAGYKNIESTSKEYVFLAEIVKDAWSKGKKVDLKYLINATYNPPIIKIGVIPVDEFISKKERKKLAEKLNTVALSAMGGIPFDLDMLIDKAKEQNKVPVIIFDLRWTMDQSEKEALIAKVTNHIYQWMLKKGGTSDLRLLFYFDEVYGFLPPYPRNPLSKRYIMLLIKQARAFGVGCILATQNPGDVDYKILTNVSTWIIGRLLTKRDRDKIGEGLRSFLDAQGGTAEHYKYLMSSLSRLQTGEFLFYNPNLGPPKLMKTRWLMTFHRGPLVEEEIKEITSKIAITPPKEEVEVKEIEELEYEISPAKPEIVQLKEQFLKSKISPKDIKKLVKELVKGNYDLKIEEQHFFYIPLLMLKAKVSMEKRVPAIRGSIHVGDLVFERTIPLTQKNINWDAEDFMGLSLKNLKHSDFTSKPLKAEYAIPVHKDPSKLLDHFLNVYLRKNTSLYKDEVLTALEDFYNNVLTEKIEKIEEKYNKKISKLKVSIKQTEAELKSLEIQEGVEEEKKTQLLEEFERTGDQKLQLKAKSVEASLARIRGKIEKVKLKLEQLQKELNELRSEKQEETEKIKSEILTAKEMEITDEWVLPKPKEITMLESIVLWVPHVYAIATIKNKNTSKKLRIKIRTFDMVGEIGKCEVCGKTLSTGYVCNYCLTLLCEEDLKQCKVCRTVLCPDHVKNCEYCNAELCDKHAFKCDKCGGIFCPKHAKHEVHAPKPKPEIKPPPEVKIELKGIEIPGAEIIVRHAINLISRLTPLEREILRITKQFGRVSVAALIDKYPVEKFDKSIRNLKQLGLIKKEKGKLIYNFPNLIRRLILVKAREDAINELTKRIEKALI